MITNIQIPFGYEGNCGNCNNWVPDSESERRRDGRLLGECAKSDGCICCHEGLTFGANGGGTFKSTEDFSCKYWEPKRNDLESPSSSKEIP